MRGALGEAVAGRAVRIGVCVCVTATSVTATRDHRVCIFFDNEGASKENMKNRRRRPKENAAALSTQRS